MRDLYFHFHSLITISEWYYKPDTIKAISPPIEQYRWFSCYLLSKSKKRQLGPLRTAWWKFSLSAKFLSRSMPFSFCLAFLRCLRELLCMLRDADMLLSECLLLFISNREWLAFCLYNACSLWGCYRCHWGTPYQSFLVEIQTFNILVLPSFQYFLRSICNILANYGFSQLCGLTLPHLIPN